MELKKSMYFSCGRLSYPVFDDPKCETVNHFYEVLRDAVRDTILEFQSRPDGNDFFYSADYDTQITEETLHVRYTLRLRHHGKTVAEKEWVMLWKNGFLLPPDMEKKPLHLRKFRKRDIM